MSFALTHEMLIPPPSSGWTWANQSSSVATTVGNNAIQLFTPKNASGDNAAVYYRTPAFSTPYTVIAKLADNPIDVKATSSVTIPFFGLGFYDSSATSILHFAKNIFRSGGAPNNGQGLAILYWSAPTTANANLGPGTNTGSGDFPGSGSADYSRVKWQMVRDNGTNLYFYMSDDGFTWVQFYNEPRTTHLSAPSKVCLVSDCAGRTDANTTLISWQEYNV